MGHWKAVKRILRYIKKTISYGITLGDSAKINLVGYADSDWANDQDDRKSTSGYVFYLGKGCITWQSKKQPTTALSTTEAEYMSMSNATKELIWLRTLLNEIGFHQSDATTIYQDNMGSIDLSQNNKNHDRTKHIDIRHHFLRDHIQSGNMKSIYCKTKEMVADMLTKPLAKPSFVYLREKLNMETSEEFNHKKEFMST